MKVIKQMSVLGLALLFITQSCTFDYPNPNAVTEDIALSNTQGLLSTSLGLRARYTLGATSGLYAGLNANGLTTQELRVVNAGNADLAALDLGGGTVTNLNPVVTNLWTNLNILNGDAERIIRNVNNIPDVPTRNYVQAHAHLFKALAIGTMAQFWEQAPINTVNFGQNAVFAPRTQVLEAAVKLCDDALTLIGTTPQPAAFTSTLGTNLDLVSCLNALSARYNNMLGNHDAAIAAAGRASLTVRSQFVFNNVAQNPLFRSSFTTNNVTQARTLMGLSGALAPNTNDPRLTFYVNNPTAETPTARGFFTSDEAPIPFYLPGEMLLIRAEAFARKNQISEAITELNRVLTKNNDPFGVNANQPAYSGPETQEAVLLEIYRQRCIELYLTGLRLEDSRRFGRPGPGQTGAERNRNYYPYPFTERSNNPINTPNDPAN